MERAEAHTSAVNEGDYAVTGILISPATDIGVRDMHLLSERAGFLVAAQAVPPRDLLPDQDAEQLHIRHFLRIEVELVLGTAIDLRCMTIFPKVIGLRDQGAVHPHHVNDFIIPSGSDFRVLAAILFPCTSGDLP